MGGCISTFYTSNSLLTIKENLFYKNLGDFGAALDFEHRGGYVYLQSNIFDGQQNPTHPVGGGTSMKLSGDSSTIVFSSSNRHLNSWSFGNGVFLMFSGYIEETNSIVDNNFAVGGCICCLFQAAIIETKNLTIMNCLGSLGNLKISQTVIFEF